MTLGLDMRKLVLLPLLACGIGMFSVATAVRDSAFLCEDACHLPPGNWSVFYRHSCGQPCCATWRS